MPESGWGRRYGDVEANPINAANSQAWRSRSFRCDRLSLKADTIVGRISYKFGWRGPLVAKFPDLDIW